MNQETRPDLNLNELHDAAKARWIRTERVRVPWAVRLAAAVNWSVLVVALAAFGLSAAHTISVFSIISPGVAWLAPVMIELGLAYAALRIKLNAIHAERTSRSLIVVVFLLTVAAFASNLAGGLTAAVLSGDIAPLSGGSIIDQFASLPLMVQAGLLTAVLMAFIVPAVSIVAGEGVAALFFDTKRRDADWIEERWREVAADRLYRMVFVRLNGNGLPARDAARVARQEVRGYLGSGITPDKAPEMPALSAETSVIIATPENAGMSDDTVPQPDTPRRSKGDAVAQLEALYGSLSGEIPSASEIIRRTGLPKSTVYDWLKKRRP